MSNAVKDLPAARPNALLTAHASSSRRLRMRAATVLVTAAALGGLTACGSDSGDKKDSVPSPGASVSASDLASRVTKAESSARYFHVKQETSAQGSVPVEVDLDITGPKSRNIKLMSGSQSGLRQIDGDMYLFSSDTDDGKHWMSVLKNDNTAIAKEVRNGILTGGSGYATTDPQEPWGKGSAKFVAKESGGLHYKVTVPADVALNALMAGEAEKSSLAKVKGKNVTYDVWLGDDDRPNKIVLDGTAFAAADTDNSSGGAGLNNGAADSSTHTMTLTYSNWGTKFTLERPPASDTASVASRLGGINPGGAAPSGKSGAGSQSPAASN